MRAIERARVLRGWTRRDLARRAHVDEGTIYDLLGQRRRPTFGSLGAVCVPLGLLLEEVVEFDELKGIEQQALGF